MKTVLITGAAGFIGSHLCEKMLLYKWRVIGIDSFNDFYSPVAKRKNAAEIQKTAIDLKSDFQMLELDIRDLEGLENVFRNNNIDLIIHLAGYAGVRPSLESPSLYTDVNINGTVNLLECCKIKCISNFIFASSSSVYGDTNTTPFSEDNPTDKPVSIYAATKKAGELLCFAYHNLYNINMACLRLFTVYGPRQRPDLAIHQMTKQIMLEEPIKLYGDGSSKRDYTFIDDIIAGILNTVSWLDLDSQARTHRKKCFELINLGSGCPISLINMVRTLEDVTGKTAKINKLPMQAGDVFLTFADISKAKSILGYEPKTDFKSGVTEFFKWYKNND